LDVMQIIRSVGAHWFPSLQYRDSRLLWFASFFAGSGNWGLIVARGWLIFDISNSSTLVGMATFAAMIPRFLLTAVTGYLVDRFDRRAVLAWSIGVAVVHNMVLAALVLGGLIQVWHLLVLSLIDGSARATQMPASAALAPNLVPRKYLLNAIALNSATQQGSRLVGAAAMGPLLTYLDPGVAFLFCTVLYALCIPLVLLIRTSSTGVVESSRGAVENLLAGFFYLYRHPLLLPFLLLVVGHCALTMAFESLLPVLSREKLNAEGGGFGYLMMAVGAGGLAGSLVVGGILTERMRGRLLVLFGIFSGVSNIALAVATSLPLALLFATAMGAAQAGFMTIFHLVVQSTVSDDVRGRVSSVNNLHIGGMMAVFNLVNGSLADLIPAPWVLAATGGAFVVMMGASLLVLPLRGLYAGGVPAKAAAH